MCLQLITRCTGRGLKNKTRIKAQTKKRRKIKKITIERGHGVGKNKYLLKSFSLDVKTFSTPGCADKEL